MESGVVSGRDALGSLSFWVIERRWARLLLIASIVGYIALIFVLAPRDEPAAPMLAVVPILVAGAWFGLKVALGVSGLLYAVTVVILETRGEGFAETLATYRGIPLLMLVLVGVVVGRLHDVSVAMTREIHRARLAELELAAAEARLQEVVDAKDDLIATVAHELRTPLTAVLGFAELLHVGDETDMPADERREMVKFIAREAFDLSGIVEDLLVAARLEVDRLVVTQVPTSLSAQISQVLESWDGGDRPEIEVVGEDVKAVADPARVRQVLRNLIANAIKYGGSQVRVEVGTEAKGVFVEVSDNGKGLPMNEWERIFEAHYRYNPDPTKPTGSGLGLTVSRGLAERMGGSLTYRFDGQRSRFRFSLPSYTASSEE